jgi:hypothetical protein
VKSHLISDVAKCEKPAATPQNGDDGLSAANCRSIDAAAAVTFSTDLRAQPSSKLLGSISAIWKKYASYFQTR